MVARLLVLAAIVLTWPRPMLAQTADTPDGIALLLDRLEAQVLAGDPTELPTLLDESVDTHKAEQFTADIFALRSDVRHAVVRERDRTPLDGAPAGDGYRVVAEVFAETERRARIVTALVDVRRPSPGEPWRITAAERLTSVDGLYRLEVNASKQFTARNFTIAAEDLLLTLQDGSVYFVESQAGVAGLVLFGRGMMRFAPAPETEKGQLRIFAGEETLTAPFDTAFVRLATSEYEERAALDALTPAPLDTRQLQRAQELLLRDGPNAFSLDLSEVSQQTWYLLPKPGEFLAEVRTKRHGTLTYSQSPAQAEDITVFDRERRRTIALYPSVERLAARGRSYDEDDLREYDVLDYDIEANVAPEQEFITATAQLRVRVRASALTSLIFRLSDSLTIQGVASAEFGRLLHLRVRNQNTVVVNLPGTILRDTEFTLLVAYSGTLESQQIDAEGLQITGRSGRPPEPGLGRQRPQNDFEPNFLLSNRSYWYPQNAISDYATATIRVTVPDGYTCVASGEPRSGQDISLRDLLTLTEGEPFVFRAADPLRYLALVVSRFIRVAETSVPVSTTNEREQISIAIDANPRQQARGRALLETVEDMIRFYAGILGDAPYPSATIALVEHDLPGGHSPGYFAVLNSQRPFSPYTWRNDPASFESFPEFFLAHELAHQWWGQAVGWQNYHEQWISEGFAQYFAALYAQHARGDEAFVDMLRQFRRWGMAESDQGPITLGYRLGHIKGNTRIFRALVYNKSAAVLHMLRRLVGDDTFFAGLRRFYTEQKFRKASTDDLRSVFEAESGLSLERFFERWIYGHDLPRLRHGHIISSGSVTVRFEQVGSRLFDLPVMVTIKYADGRSQDVVVPVMDKLVERTIDTDGPVRQVQINRDHTALAAFEES